MVHLDQEVQRPSPTAYLRQSPDSGYTIERNREQGATAGLMLWVSATESIVSSPLKLSTLAHNRTHQHVHKRRQENIEMGVTTSTDRENIATARIFIITPITNRAYIDRTVI